MQPNGEAIVLTGISKTFTSRSGTVVALDDVNLTIKEGEFLCIVGPSGCGKTTLLRILAGLEVPTGGRVEIRVREPGKPVNSMVFQEQSVFPWYTVKENVAYGLAMRGVPRKEREAIALHYLKITGLSKFAHAYPHQLSGGMKQRVSVARAFANDPSILLLDEPFGSLDEQTRVILQQELLRIWEGTRKTAVFITHSIDEALGLGDRVLVMTARPGRVKAILEVDLPRPRDLTLIRSRPRFLELFDTIWFYLREEVAKATELKA
ncbi:MAG TPA: ABC transporter ATP-binding protein [Firmicutes bacterium]|nr:NitT/TauT family transport system ATP-binding protein [Bacillota bacterium]MDK2927981.1 NitT/TauT family transport system ATP-binding protein [Bacillota bacterium]HHV58270.1 ABC transporter ATP-binding protein [Bacillota bacterium]